jgi:hypothetical protein
MSKIPITSDHPLGHLVPEGQTAYIAEGGDRITTGEVFNEDGSVMMVAKSLRMSASLASRAENAGHPDGFSGVVREAVAEWLERHTGGEAEAADAKAALAVLTRIVAGLDHAA